MPAPLARLCRFAAGNAEPRVGLAGDDGAIADLSAAGVRSVAEILGQDDPATAALQLASVAPRMAPAGVRLLAPVDRQEVWAAGVTYLRSKAARMEESDFSATAYDRVYAAARPELFFKAVAEKVVGPGDGAGIRRDARWNVPEPELALVFSPSGRVVGATIGNDMSSRDIEGENLLYLPQAKIYDRSCALGPWITLGVTEETVRTWQVRIAIRRAGAPVFAGETALAQLKRSFAELGDYLFRSQRFPHGVVLLTGTGIVPPDSFTLAAGDEVEIAISGVGTLTNPIVVV